MSVSLSFCQTHRHHPSSCLHILVLLLFTLGIGCRSVPSQPVIQEYLGGWAGELKEAKAFAFDLRLSRQSDDQYELSFHGKDKVTNIVLTHKDGYYHGRFEEDLTVMMKMTENGPITFIQFNQHLCYVDFIAQKKDHWQAHWNLLVEADLTPTLYLALEQDGNQSYSASTFFKEPSLHYMYGVRLIHSTTAFAFKDLRSNIEFDGTFLPGTIMLTLSFLNENSTIEMTPLPYDQWQRGEMDNTQSKHVKEVQSNPAFDRLKQDILSDTLERTHAVVISQHDKVIFEHYFDGFRPEIPHDTRSASKSFAGAMTGIFIKQGLLDSERQPIKPFFEETYPNIDWSDGKDEINLHHLLTMSSGLDAIDFGIKRRSYASEGAYQEQLDWTKHILYAPMVNPAGREGNYGSGNPHLIGAILQTQIEEPLAFYIHQQLFQPMGIVNYRIQTDNMGTPYFGGGWYITARDLVKFGQLYMDNGKWNGKQLIPANWVAQSLQSHVTLENALKKNKYGYLFWYGEYELNGRTITTIDARGSGGQYLMMIPELSAVVSITSGNYFNRKGFQPERIMKDYILPVLIESK